VGTRKAPVLAQIWNTQVNNRVELARRKAAQKRKEALEERKEAGGAERRSNNIEAKA
jgi:hypothetical protein